MSSTALKDNWLTSILTVLTYPVVKTLIRILEADFVYPTSRAKRLRMIDNPELLVVALVVVAVKLSHPFPGENRAPISQVDSEMGQIDWAEWQKAMALRHEGIKGLQVGAEHLFGVGEAMTADNAQLDDFMDWMERTWVGAEDPRSKSYISLWQVGVANSPSYGAN